MDVRLTWTDRDVAGDFVVPNVLSPRDLVSIPDNMDETVLHTQQKLSRIFLFVDFNVTSRHKILEAISTTIT